MNSGPEASRKPARLGIYLPFAVALVLIAGGSGAWLWLRSASIADVGRSAAALRAAGGEAHWSRLTVGGYPFYLDVDAEDVRLADASGWGLAAAAVRGESSLFEPDRWLFAFPSGVTLAAPGGGRLTLGGASLHGGIDHMEARPPRASFEADQARLSTGSGGAPFGLARAAKIGLYLRPGPGGEGALLLDVTGGGAAPGGWLARLAGGAPLSLRLEGVISHAPALAGLGPAAALRAWSAAGGAFEIRKLAISAGPGGVAAEGGALSADADGRLQGSVPVSFGGRSTNLRFGAGGVYLGPIRVGPAAKLF